MFAVKHFARPTISLIGCLIPFPVPRSASVHDRSAAAYSYEEMKEIAKRHGIVMSTRQMQVFAISILTATEHTRNQSLISCITGSNIDQRTGIYTRFLLDGVLF